ncbi:MAG: hypothetical protein M1269_10005 [Chloroflexi bacterium]|nr:hypothetical protein [Chloroflexota bacterium]
MKYKVLWIEDQYSTDLNKLYGPIYTSRRYDFVAAQDVSDGIDQIMKSEFQAIIADIRIPPGKKEEWIELFNQSGGHKDFARLGLHLLYSLLGHEKAKVKIENIPGWLEANRIGVFSVESSEELKDLKEMNIRVFQQKTTGLPKTILLELLDKILQQQGISMTEKI